MAVNTRTIPSAFQILVGRDPALSATETNQDHIYERVGAVGEVLIELQNTHPTENLVLTLQNCATNLNGDYTTRQTRQNTTLGNTITVPPKGTATCIVDGPNSADSQKFWRFRVSNQLRASGILTVSHARGEFIPRRLFG